MLNAVEYCVFPGAVNMEAKRRVLEEIARSEAKHFLVLLRDAGCQFRALYSYCPDSEQVVKLYGTGPKHVNDRMFDKFFKWVLFYDCLLLWNFTVQPFANPLNLLFDIYTERGIPPPPIFCGGNGVLDVTGIVSNGFSLHVINPAELLYLLIRLKQSRVSNNSIIFIHTYLMIE